MHRRNSPAANRTRSSSIQSKNTPVVKIILAFLLLTATIAGASTAWHQWRGPGQAGVTDATNLPVQWDDGENILWKTALPGPGSSQPVVWDATIFVTSFSGYNPSTGQNIGDPVPVDGIVFHVTRVDMRTGKVIWNRKIEPLNPLEQRSKNVAYHGFATPTPIIEANRLYVSFGTGGVFCLDHSGAQIWSASIGTDNPDWGYAASLASYESLIIANACVESGALIALDKSTGKEVWRNTEGLGQGMNQISRSTPLIFQNAEGEDRMAILAAGQFIQVHDPATGELLWKEGRWGGGYASGTPVVSEDGSVLYAAFGGSHGPTAMAAFRTGDDVAERVIWETDYVGHGLVPPVLYRGRLYYGAYGGVKPSAAQGFGCIDAATGEKVFHHQPDEFGDNIYSPPLAGDGKIYIQSQLLGTWVLEATDEYNLLAQNVLDEDRVETEMKLNVRQTGNKSGNGFVAMPIPLANGHLLLRGYWGLYCVRNPNLNR